MRNKRDAFTSASDGPQCSVIIWKSINPMDEDLESMSRDDLIAEVAKLRSGIRKHRDTSLHELCWHQPELWGLLPEKTDPLPVVPSWRRFMEGCVKYRQSLDEQAPAAQRSEEPYGD